MTDIGLKAPGLYLRTLEAESGPLPRVAVTAFVGIAERGPLNEPQTVRSYGDFLDVFGDGRSFGALDESVHAFFLNGGEEAFIVRAGQPLPNPALANPSPCVARESLVSAVCETDILDVNGEETMTLEARSPGSWGNRLKVRFLGDSTREMDVARLTAPAAANATQVEVDCVYDFRKGGSLRLIHRTNTFRSSVHVITAIDKNQRRLSVDPKLPQDYPLGSLVFGSGFRFEATDGSRREVFDGLSMNPGHPRYFVALINGTPGSPFLDLARDGHSLLVSAKPALNAQGQPVFKFKPAADPNQWLAFSKGGDGATYAQATLMDNSISARASLIATARNRGREGNDMRVRAQAFTGKLVLPVPSEPAAAKDQLVVEDIRGWVVGDQLTITHPTNQAVSEVTTIAEVLADKHVLRLNGPLVNIFPRNSDCMVADRFNLIIEQASQPEATEWFFNLSMASNSPRYFDKIINDIKKGSQLVCVAASPGATSPPTGVAILAGGTNPGEIPLEYFAGYNEDGTLLQVGTDPGRLGLATLESSPEVSLVSIPDLVYLTDDELSLQSAQAQILFHCQKMGDRFALLDIPKHREPARALEWISRITDEKLSRYGAIYYPWISFASGGQIRLLPPSGAVAGLIARSERQDGAGRAPGNLQLKGAVGVEWDLDAVMQGELNLAGINCIRKFEAGALRLWGARTLSREEDYLYVHNRRVILLAIKSMTSGLRWAVFEPNNQNLQQRIKDSLDGVLRGMLARGLTAGQSPEESYYVKVSDGTAGDSSQVVAEIGIALSKPAEFIVITIKRSPEILTLVEDDA